MDTDTGEVIITTDVTGTPTATTTVTVPPSATGTQSSIFPVIHHGGLSAGAKAGISVAVILVAIILGVLFFLGRQKQRASRTHSATVQPNVHELLTNAKKFSRIVYETQHTEMDEQNSGPLKAKDKMAAAVSSIGTENEGAGTSEDLGRGHGLTRKVTSHLWILRTTFPLLTSWKLRIQLANLPARRVCPPCKSKQLQAKVNRRPTMKNENVRLKF